MTKNKVRLIYVCMNKHLSLGKLKLEQEYFISKPYTLPEGMNLKDSYKTISYLSDLVENKYYIEPASRESVKIVCTLLNQLGFKENNEYHHGFAHSTEKFPLVGSIESRAPSLEGVIDLFTVDGMPLFKRSDLYLRYFNWYTPKIKENEIQSIYSKIKNNYNSSEIEDILEK